MGNLFAPSRKPVAGGAGAASGERPFGCKGAAGGAGAAAFSVDTGKGGAFGVAFGQATALALATRHVCGEALSEPLS